MSVTQTINTKSNNNVLTAFLPFGVMGWVLEPIPQHMSKGRVKRAAFGVGTLLKGTLAGVSHYYQSTFHVFVNIGT